MTQPLPEQIEGQIWRVSTLYKRDHTVLRFTQTGLDCVGIAATNAAVSERPTAQFLLAEAEPPALIPMQISSLCAGTHKEAICLTKGSTARKL